MEPAPTTRLLRTTGIWDELTDDERLAVKHARAEIEMVVDNESMCALSFAVRRKPKVDEEISNECI